MQKNALNYKVIGDTAVDNEGDTVPATLWNTSVSLKLISASKADGNNFVILLYTPVDIFLWIKLVKVIENICKLFLNFLSSHLINHVEIINEII